MKLSNLIVLLLTILFLSCDSSTSQTQVVKEEKIPPPVEVSDEVIQAFLDTLNLTGAILIFDEMANTYYSNDFDWASTGQLPASTFKIPNTIIALETGVAANSDHLFIWDGTDHWLDAWEQDLTLKEAFAVSCVPCYQEVARSVGTEQMRTELDRLGYPDMVFGPETVDNFWLQGASRISPKEQVEFLRRIYDKELPLRSATQRAIQDVMIMEKTDYYTLSGKTGWSIDGEKNNGWFVGFLERERRKFYFATNVEPGPGFNMDEFPAIRVKVTKFGLAQLGAI